MPSWDRRTPEAQAKTRDALLRRQLRDAVGPFSPYWRERFAALRLPASSVSSARDLPKLPAVGERDVCPDGDAFGASRLVLRADEAGYALHTRGVDLRRAMLRRLTGSATYRRMVEAEVRPTTYHFAGRGLTYPIASTRADLDLIARAGNRAWHVLGLTAADVLVSAVPVAPRLDHVFLSYAALGAGTPALFPGADPLMVAETLRLVPATVLAVRPVDAVDTIGALDELGADLTTLTTLLLVGHPTLEQRLDAREALAAAGNATAAVLALYGPDAGRVMWAECRPSVERGVSAGYHTYPDLDVVEAVDAESGGPLTDGAAAELVVTQLGFHGSALVRWRTGDLLGGAISTDKCIACGRTVPRVPATLYQGALQPFVTLTGEGDVCLDLRSVAGALVARPDVADWQLEVRPARRGGHDLLVYVAPTGDEAEVSLGVYADTAAVAGVPPTQVVVVGTDELARRRPAPDSVTRRVAVR